MAGLVPNLSRIRRLRNCSAVVLVLVAAATARAAEPLSHLGFDAASYSPMAREGLEEIYAGRLFHFGVPAAAARMVFGAQVSAAKQAGLEPGSPQAMFYAAGRLPSPPDRAVGTAAGFALGESVFERNGVATININCFSCHAGVVNGQVVAGLGNSHINQSDPRRARTRGDNFGPYEVWRLGARLVDPEKQGLVVGNTRTELEGLLESLELPPVDPMPWWLMKYKRLNYWYADGGSHSAANFSINFTTPHAEMNAHRAEHVDRVAKALAFARETQSPLFPATLDAGLVQRGADLFHGRTRPGNPQGFTTCKTCHGSYTKKPNSDLSHPGSWAVDYNFSDVLRNPKTDPAYNSVLRQLKPIAEHINKLAVYFTQQGTPELVPHAAVPDREGYVAPPLVGVWASAPYFHNGSVPTVTAVLNSKIRPPIWARDNLDPHAYDLVKVGLAHREVSQAEFDASAAAAAGKPFTAPAAVAHSTLYDTRAYGHGNMGHTFGDNLSDGERAAVIEFLKSLSGPDM